MADTTNINFARPLLFEDDVDTREIGYAAQALGVTEATVRRWLYQDDLIKHYNLSAARDESVRRAPTSELKARAAATAARL